VLLRVCLLIMLAQWVDLFWMILPPFMVASPVVFLWEIGPIAAALAGFFLMTFRVLAKYPLIPKQDPYLIESLATHHS
jgi:hypothetical protein